jgi:hypothetical protein
MHQLAGRNLCLIPVVSVLVDAVKFVIQYDDQRRKYSMQIQDLYQANIILVNPNNIVQTKIIISTI